MAAKIGRLARRTQGYAKSAELLLLAYAAALPLANWALNPMPVYVENAG